MSQIRMVGRRLEWGCLCCDHPVSAMSPESLQAAMDDHAEHVNCTADRDTDVHFHEHRMDVLLRD